MCGRYSNHVTEMSGWTALLGDWPGEAVLSRNIAPTQSIPVVLEHLEHENIRCSHMMRWGLVPAWSDIAKPKYATFNARAESVSQKPAFRNAFNRSQTCLIPAAGYYEWTGEKGHKTMHYVQRHDQAPLLMAGLWERWNQGMDPLYSCTILTRAAVPSLVALHPRMPLILDPIGADAWLQHADEEILESLLSTDNFKFEIKTATPDSLL